MAYGCVGRRLRRARPVRWHGRPRSDVPALNLPTSRPGIPPTTKYRPRVLSLGFSPTVAACTAAATLQRSFLSRPQKSRHVRHAIYSRFARSAALMAPPVPNPLPSGRTCRHRPSFNVGREKGGDRMSQRATQYTPRKSRDLLRNLQRELAPFVLPSPRTTNNPGAGDRHNCRLTRGRRAPQRRESPAVYIAFNLSPFKT